MFKFMEPWFLRAMFEFGDGCVCDNISYKQGACVSLLLSVQIPFLSIQIFGLQLFVVTGDNEHRFEILADIAIFSLLNGWLSPGGLVSSWHFIVRFAVTGCRMALAPTFQAGCTLLALFIIAFHLSYLFEVGTSPAAPIARLQTGCGSDFAQM
jgi:hypothetical protein